MTTESTLIPLFKNMIYFSIKLLRWTQVGSLIFKKQIKNIPDKNKLLKTLINKNWIRRDKIILNQLQEAGKKQEKEIKILNWINWMFQIKNNKTEMTRRVNKISKFSNKVQTMLKINGKIKTVTNFLTELTLQKCRYQNLNHKSNEKVVIRLSIFKST
jgi:hypothetical protein